MIKILGYRGVSPISKMIRFQTRSPYSHVAIEFQDGKVLEAWYKGGVRLSNNWMSLHSPGTLVDVYEFHKGGICNFDLQTAEVWGKTQIGKKYDFTSVFRFVSRRKAPSNDKWFCSELVETFIRKGGGNLLNGNPSEHSPRDTLMSPCLYLADTRDGKN